MNYSWPSLAFTALLSLVSMTSVYSTEPTRLTKKEHACQIMGTIAFDHAHERDRGVPYLHLVDVIRRNFPEGSELDRAFKTIVLSNLRHIYDDPHRRSPAVTQQVAELTCLRNLEAVERE